MSKLGNIILECASKVLDGKEETLGDYIDPTKQQIKELILDIIGGDKPKWNIGEYQVIEDVLGNNAQQLYDDMKLGYDEAKREIRKKVEEL